MAPTTSEDRAAACRRKAPMFRVLVSLIATALVACASSPDEAEDEAMLAGAMTRPHMEKLLRSIDENARGIPGMVEFRYEGVEMTCISDIEFGRMRIVTPIIRVEELSGEQVASILEANFHTALDARYATSQGVLYAAYIHPLAPLTERELAAAVRQVATLARTFGTAYTSGELAFGGGEAL